MMPVPSTLGGQRHRIRTKANPDHRKDSIVGLSMLLQVYLTFGYWTYRELEHEWRCKCH